MAQCSGYCLLAGELAANYLDQWHAWNRIEKMHTDQVLRTRQCLGYLVNAQTGRVGSNQAVLTDLAFSLLQQRVLQRKVLGHRLENQFDLVETGKVELTPN
ncbi:hypothetical protein D3C86_1811190 [compost metagenome]